MGHLRRSIVETTFAVPQVAIRKELYVQDSLDYLIIKTDSPNREKSDVRTSEPRPWELTRLNKEAAHTYRFGPILSCPHCLIIPFSSKMS
jgi:hypothetical protein